MYPAVAVAMSANAPPSRTEREGAGHPRFVRSESMGEPPTLAETRKGGPARKLRPFLSACCRVLEKCLTRADTVREAMFQAWSAGAQL